jgi:hypothetical protein
MTAFLYLSSFAVLQWAILEISYEVMGLAVLCVLACVWDVWSSFRSARAPAPALAALTALKWTS